MSTDSTRRLGSSALGSIAEVHLGALARLGRTTLVGVVSRTEARAAGVAREWGGRPYLDHRRKLDVERPDVAYVCLPPYLAPDACAELVARGIPFLTEKPLGAGAGDGDAPTRLAVEIGASRLVVAVGQHLRGLDLLPEVRTGLAGRPVPLLAGRWLDSMPGSPWWHHAAEGGGQVVEQATHRYDLARVLVGEAVVVSAASTRATTATADDDVADATVVATGAPS